MIWLTFVIRDISSLGEFCARIHAFLSYDLWHVSGSSNSSSATTKSEYLHLRLYYAALLIGRITGLARPSVCPSVRLSRSALNSKRKRRIKKQLVCTNISHYGSNGRASFWPRRSKVLHSEVGDQSRIVSRTAAYDVNIGPTSRRLYDNQRASNCCDLAHSLQVAATVCNQGRINAVANVSNAWRVSRGPAGLKVNILFY